jgi:hypothetical protein
MSNAIMLVKNLNIIKGKENDQAKIYKQKN